MPRTDLPVAALKAELFKALGHPARIRVLELLVDGERSVGELAEAVDLEISHLSQQLAVLRRANVVVTRRAGNAVFYSLRDPRMSQLLTVARHMLVTSLEQSQALLTGLQSAGDLTPDPRHGAAAAASDDAPAMSAAARPSQA